jgi:nitrogen fixation protein FixH
VRRLVVMVGSVGLILLALGLAALARADPVTGREFTAAAGPYVVDFSVDRLAEGDRLVVVAVRTPAREPVDAATVTVSSVMPAMGHAVQRLETVADGPGRFRGSGTLFTMPGPWEVDVRVAVEGRTHTARFSVEVR